MLNDYKYAIGTTKQAGNYDKITNYLVLHVRKTYKHGRDIANAIERQEPFNFKLSAPKLQVSSIVETDNTTPQEKLEIKCQNNQYKIEYEVELQLHLNQKSHYHTNLGKAYAFLFGQCTTGLQHRIEAKAEYEAKIKGDPIRLPEVIKENSLSFDHKKKADIVIIDAMMNLMTTRQRDNEELTKYTKHFKAARDLCKEKYGGILRIPMLTQKESTWDSDPETSYKTAFASFLSFLYLKNTDQTKYSSFIKKMTEDLTTGWENVYPIHIEDAQHVLSIHNYDQAYHDKHKKQQDNHNRNHMSSKNEDHSATGECTQYSGNVPCTDGRMMLQVWREGSPKYYMYQECHKRAVVPGQDVLR